MKELTQNELININGGSLETALSQAGGIALSGIKTGIGIAMLGAGAVTADAPLAYAGGSIAVDGIYDITNYV